MESMINDFVEVRGDEKLKMLTVKFLGFIKFEDFKQAVEFEYELIRKNQLKKCVVDLRLIPVYAPGMPEYVKDEWFPTVSKIGIKHIGFVLPEAALGKISMNKAHQITEEILGITVANFKDTEDALNWLKSV
jgi:hypothetical protein